MKKRDLFLFALVSVVLFPMYASATYQANVQIDSGGNVIKESEKPTNDPKCRNEVVYSHVTNFLCVVF